MRPDSSSVRRAVLTLAGVLVIGALAAFGYTHRLTTTAERLLSAARSGKYEVARTLLSTALREQKRQDWLPQMLEETGLLDARSEEWEEPTIEGGYGEMRGTLTRPSGEEVKVSLHFVREQLDWRLYAIKRPFIGDLPTAIQPPMPDRVEQIALVRRAMQDFTASVKSRDMSFFHSTLAPAKRSEVSAANLDAAFKRFFDIEEDLSTLDQITPSLSTEDTENSADEVTVSGYFATEPKQVHFQQKYCFEKNDWRLLSFKISMR